MTLGRERAPLHSCEDGRIRTQEGRLRLAGTYLNLRATELAAERLPDPEDQKRLVFQVRTALTAVQMTSCSLERLISLRSLIRIPRARPVIAFPVSRWQQVRWRRRLVRLPCFFSSI